MTRFLLVAAVAVVAVLLLLLESAVGDRVTIPAYENSTFSYVFERKKYARAIELEMSYRMAQQPQQKQDNKIPTQGVWRGGTICCTLEQRDREAGAVWLPITTIFCNKLQCEYESNGTYSVKYSKYERWNTSSEHRLMFVTSYTGESQEDAQEEEEEEKEGGGNRINEERCVVVNVHQPSLSSGEQEGIALGILFTACFALCLGRIFRGHVIVAGCIVSFVMLAAAQKFPTSEEVIGWIDANTLFLNVTTDAFAYIMHKAGLTRWIAGHILERSRGVPRRIGVCGWLLAYVVSIFLPAMASLHFCSNVAFAAAEIININPFPIIIGQAIMINIGSCIFPNDPSLYLVTKHFGIHSYETIYNILPCSLICCAASIGFLAYYFRNDLNNKIPPLFQDKAKKTKNKYYDYDDDDDDDDDDSNEDSSDDEYEEEEGGNVIDSPKPREFKKNEIELKNRKEKRSVANASSETASLSSKKAMTKKDKQKSTSDTGSQPKFDRRKYAIKDVNTVVCGIVLFVLFNIVSFLCDFVLLEPGIISMFFVCTHIFLTYKVFSREITNGVIDVLTLSLICVAFIFINSLNELGLCNLFCK